MPSVSMKEGRTLAMAVGSISGVAAAASAAATRTAPLEDAIDPDNYPYELEQRSNGWLICYPDLPGCTAHGSTRAEAMANGEKAVHIWIQAHADHDIPLPAEYRRLKGNLRIRVPREMHGRLAEAAATESVSFNGLVEKVVTGELKELQNSPVATHNGEWVQRMSPATHHALRFEAERQGVSLNMLIVALISRACGRRASGTNHDHAERDEAA